MFMIALTAVTVIILFGLYQKMHNRMCTSKKKLEGRVAIVTGGTLGMGLEISKDLAKRGAKVIIACPFEEEGLNAQKEIIKTSGNEKVEFKILDLASTDSVRDFVAGFFKKEKRLDILINNAGVGFPINKGSYNGTNFIMHVNYFGHYLLTILLLPLLKKSGTQAEPSRIVNTSSSFHRFGVLDHKRLDRTDFTYRLRCYGNSKFCFVLFGHELSKKLKGTNVVVNAVDPGGVGTTICASWHPAFSKFYVMLCKILFKTPQQGAQTALYVALDHKSGKVSGQFFKNCELGRAKKAGYDDVLSKQLWEDSITIVGLQKEELQQCLEA